jgi:UDP-glucose 6-dehydrogenase
LIKNSDPLENEELNFVAALDKQQACESTDHVVVTTIFDYDVEANCTTRKDFIADSILKKSPKMVGIYRLVMKADSNRFRASSNLEFMKHTTEKVSKL